MAGKAPKRKGNRLERKLVKLLINAGLNAKRIPLSGAVNGFPGDIQIDNLIAEVKGRKNGFKTLYSWLDNRDILFIRADNKKWLVIQPLEVWIGIIGAKQSVSRAIKQASKVDTR